MSSSNCATVSSGAWTRIALAACWMSYSHLLRSGGIQENLGLLHGLPEVGIAYGSAHHQVDGAAKEITQGRQQAEEMVGDGRFSFRTEIDEEVEITVGCLRGAAGGRTEELEPLHEKATAEFIDLTSPGCDGVVHSCHSSTSMPSRAPPLHTNGSPDPGAAKPRRPAARLRGATRTRSVPASWPRTRAMALVAAAGTMPRLVGHGPAPIGRRRALPRSGRSAAVVNACPIPAPPRSASSRSAA